MGSKSSKGESQSKNRTFDIIMIIIITLQQEEQQVCVCRRTIKNSAVQPAFKNVCV